MDKLSLELVREILSHVRRRDLPAVRLVCRPFSDISVEFLFSEIHTLSTETGLSNLVALSQTPRLARLVRELVLHVDDFKQLTWHPFVAQVQSQSLQSREGPRHHLYLRMKAADRAHFKFTHTPLYTSLLTTALGNLSRLSTVEMRHRQPDYDDLPRTPWERSASDLARLFRLERSHGENGELDDLRAFTALINAVHDSGTRLSAFRTDGSIAQRVFRDRELLHKAAIVFATCTELELDFSYDHFYDVDAHIRANPLFNVLAPCRRLEQLKLYGTIRLDPTTPFACYFGAHHVWHHLRVLDFFSLDMHAHELVDLLTRHKATLRDVSIRCTALYTGHWDEVMVFMRKELLLEWFSLGVDLQDFGEDGEEYSYDERQNEDMMDYVMGAGKRLPRCGEPNSNPKPGETEGDGWTC